MLEIRYLAVDEPLVGPRKPIWFVESGNELQPIVHNTFREAEVSAAKDMISDLQAFIDGHLESFPDMGDTSIVCAKVWYDDSGKIVLIMDYENDYVYFDAAKGASK